MCKPVIVIISASSEKQDTPGGAHHGGWLFALSTDGFIMHMAEFVGAESLPQRYFFLAAVKDEFPNITVAVHDDACHLRKYATARAADGTMAASLAYPSMQYIVDRLHAKGHVDPWCKQHCLPDVPSNAALLQNRNTQACEQKFSILGRHKFKLKCMRQFTAGMYMNEIVELLNKSHLPSQQRQ